MNIDQYFELDTERGFAVDTENNLELDTKKYFKFDNGNCMELDTKKYFELDINSKLKFMEDLYQKYGDCELGQNNIFYERILLLHEMLDIPVII